MQKNRQGHKMVYSVSSSYGPATWKEVMRPKNYDELWEKMYELAMGGPSREQSNFERYTAIVAKWNSIKNEPEIRALVKDFAKRDNDGELPDFDLLLILKQYLDGNLCGDCRKNKNPSFYITDAFSGEQVCQNCGRVKNNQTFGVRNIFEETDLPKRKVSLGNVHSITKQLAYIRRSATKNISETES